MKRLNYHKRVYYFIYLLLVAICTNFSCENYEKAGIVSINDMIPLCDAISEYVISDSNLIRVYDNGIIKVNVDKNYIYEYELYISKNSFYKDDCLPVNAGDCLETREIFVFSCLFDNFYVGIEPGGPFVNGTKEQPNDFDNIVWQTGINWIYYNGISAEFWATNNSGFIPIKFIKNDCVYVGWIEVEIYFEKEIINILRCAYKSNV